MNDDEIIARGELCEALLRSEMFNTLVAMYEQSLSADVLATKPSEAAKREEIYASLWGLRGFQSFMRLCAEAKAHIQEPIDTTDDIDDPRVHDIT